MKKTAHFFISLLVASSALANPALTNPIASSDLVFEEVDGFVAVEAEHFFKQEKSDVRAWYLTTADREPGIEPDADPSHVARAGGGAYLEVLPDTRRNHDEKLIKGENFINTAGEMAVLSYKVFFNTPGKYFVWARTHSTGTEDNGLHVGLDGTWPPSGQRMQWTAKGKWAWASKQRTAKVHTGVAGLLFLNIEKAGEHTIQFSMREDGFEFDAFIMTTNSRYGSVDGPAPPSKVKIGALPKAFKFLPAPAAAPPSTPSFTGALFGKREPNGDGSVVVSGELKQWHKVTLTLDGPFAHERDNKPNPFTDFAMVVRIKHSSGSPSYLVPGYFAADGKAGESSAEGGNKWRAHLSPDKAGVWTYQVELSTGPRAAIEIPVKAKLVHRVKGEFTVAASDKKGRDLRGKGRLTYVGKHHLQFAGNKEYFLKAGADAPETFLAYADFDGTVAGKPGKAPLKTWKPHLRDWMPGDPSWKGGKGKGMIGAINYLSGKGCNVFSFLPYNAGGDGENVWPFIARDDKFHYDCSKLDQWGIVFDHATAKGMYLHFKLQETENDDNERGGQKGSNKGVVPAALDGGDLGPQRKLYCRELIARFGHNLALNWNLGEENTQTTRQQREMAKFLADTDPYNHLIVVHTYPRKQDEVYRPLLGNGSVLRGASLQNSNVRDCHKQVVKWTRESAAKGKPWVIGFDEPGSAGEGMPADPGYPGMPKNFNNPSIHDTRKFALWGTILAGGGGVEYYFGYKLPQNDLLCEDWRSRDQSWDYCRIALDFFRDQKIPFAEMSNQDELVGNERNDNSVYCYAKKAEVYLVYLPNGGRRDLDLSGVKGEFKVQWFNPREGGALKKDASRKGGRKITLIAPDAKNDWLAIVRR